MTPTAELRKIEWAQSGRADPLFLLCTEPGDSCGKSNPFPPTHRRPTVDHSLVAGGAQRQWLQACLPDGNQPQCLSSPCLSRPVPRGPSLNLRRLPVWPALRFPIIDDAKLAPIVVKMIEVFGTKRKAEAESGTGTIEAESGTGTILTRWGVLDYGSA